MKTSYSIAWECKHLIHVFLIFILKDNMEMILQIHESCIKSFSSTILSEFASTTPTSAPSIESVGE